MPNNQIPAATLAQPLVSQRTLAGLLGALALIGPLSVDAYLPAFDAISRDMHVSAAKVQLTLITYMVAFAFMSLWHGALSDALGRRRIILFSLLGFSLASAGCALSTHVGWLAVFRVAQGASAGAGTVVGRAIVRDMYDGTKAAKMLAWVSMIFALSPAVAPILGGWIVTALQWRCIFIFLAGYTLLLFFACYRALPETLPAEHRQSLSPANMTRNYLKVAKSSSFRYAAGALAFNFSGLFLYVAAAPVILVHHLGLSANQFGWQFIPMVGGIFLGSLASERLIGWLPERSQVVAGYVLMLATGIANVGYHAWHLPSLPWSIIPIFFFAFGMSISAPVLTMQVLNLFDHLRGLVASMQTFTMVLLAAATTALLAPWLQHSLLSLALGQLGLAAIGLILWLATLPRRPLASEVHA